MKRAGAVRWVWLILIAGLVPGILYVGVVSAEPMLQTAVPPTDTDTPVPVTATATLVPVTATATLVPATATATATLVPATATVTATYVRGVSGDELIYYFGVWREMDNLIAWGIGLVGVVVVIGLVVKAIGGRR